MAKIVNREDSTMHSFDDLVSFPDDEIQKPETARDLLLGRDDSNK